MTRRRKGSALLALPLLLIACQGATSVPEAVPPAEIATFVGQPFPANARNLRTARRDGIDRLVLARFDTDTAGADSFARAVTGKPLQAGTDPGLGYLGGSLDWWAAEMPPGASGVEATRDGNRTVKLLAVPGPNSVQTVYLAAFSS